MTFSPPAPPALADRTPGGGPAPADRRPQHRAWSGLGWGLLAALFCAVVPIGIILLGGRQISIHMSVAAGTVMIPLLVFGPALLPAALIAVGVGWSRLVLKAHTTAQLLAGTVLGAAAALTFALLR